MVIFVRSTVAVLVVLFKVNVHSLLLVQKRTNQEKRHRHIPWCLIPARVGGPAELAAARLRQLRPDSAAACLHVPRSARAGSRHNAGQSQNRGGACLILLQVKCLMNRKF